MIGISTRLDEGKELVPFATTSTVQRKMDACEDKQLGTTNYFQGMNNNASVCEPANARG